MRIIFLIVKVSLSIASNGTSYTVMFMLPLRLSSLRIQKISGFCSAYRYALGKLSLTPNTFCNESVALSAFLIRLWFATSSCSLKAVTIRSSLSMIRFAICVWLLPVTIIPVCGRAYLSFTIVSEALSAGFICT